MGWKTRKEKLSSDQPDAEAPLENDTDQEAGYDRDMEADAAALARLAQVSAQDVDRDPFVLDLNNDAFRTDSQRTSLDPSAFPWYKPGDAPSAAPRQSVSAPGKGAIESFGVGEPRPARPTPPAGARGITPKDKDEYVEPGFPPPTFGEPAAGAGGDAAPDAPGRRFVPDWGAAAPSFSTADAGPSWAVGNESASTAWAAPEDEPSRRPSPALDVPRAFDDPPPPSNGAFAAPSPPPPAFEPEPRGPHIAPFQPVSGFSTGAREPQGLAPRAAPFQPVTGFGPGTPDQAPQPATPDQSRPAAASPTPEADQHTFDIQPPVEPPTPAGASYYQHAGPASASPYPSPPPAARVEVEGQSINSFSREAVAPGLVTGEGDYSIPKVAPFIVSGGVQEEELRNSDGHYLIIRMRNLAASYKLTKDVTTIGRPDSVTKNYPDVEIELDDGVSRKHAEIRLKNDQYYVVDVGSKNGTLLNGDLLDIDQENKLAHGDRIRVGERTEIVFE